MNKKEIAEIRRRLTVDKNNISCVRGCYVNEKRDIVSTFSMPLNLMPVEESEKYLAIFKRTLSGTKDKNLIDINFSTSQVSDSEEHKLLAALRSTALKDDAIVKEFFDKTIASFSSEGNYLILLMFDTYDVPHKYKDGNSQEDSSSQFSYIMCSVCPVKMTKPALSYIASEKSFRNSASEWIVSNPELGFIFPAFDNRAANIYNALYYTGNSSENHKELTDALFKCDMPMPADEQKEVFMSLLSESLENECSCEVVQAVHKNISDIITEYDSDKTFDDPLLISKGEIKSILSSNGVSEEHVAAFSDKFDEQFGAASDLAPQNIIDTKQIEVRTPAAVIRIAPENGDILETRVIDGIKYILVRADEDVEINGVNIKIMR